MAKKNGQTRRSRHSSEGNGSGETKHQRQSREGTERARGKRTAAGGEYVSKPAWRDKGVRYERGYRS